MGDGLPLKFAKNSRHGNRHEGKHEQRESECTFDFLLRGRVDALPFRSQNQHGDQEQRPITAQNARNQRPEEGPIQLPVRKVRERANRLLSAAKDVPHRDSVAVSKLA